LYAMSISPTWTFFARIAWLSVVEFAQLDLT
jgi:hypothetical protein